MRTKPNLRVPCGRVAASATLGRGTADNIAVSPPKFPPKKPASADASAGQSAEDVGGSTPIRVAVSGIPSQLHGQKKTRLKVRTRVTR